MSRRSGGLSIGINFNTNNACNWRCIYCQVPNLKLGSAPQCDFDVLSEEFNYFLNYVLQGNFYNDFNIPFEQRVIKDIAISGNGEPTSLKLFDQAIKIIGEIAIEFKLFPKVKFVLISNGSLFNQSQVQDGLEHLAKLNGEIWFKLDSATEEGRRLINNISQTQQKLINNLKISSELCETKLQTCLFHYGELIWSNTEKYAYLNFLKLISTQKIKINTILLYSIARISYQPEANELSAADFDELSAFAADIKSLGFNVGVNA